MKGPFVLLVTGLTALGGLQIGRAQDAAPTRRWYKGNLHAHTINSDGDSSPSDVMAWYKLHGYQFLAITDHNTFTDPALIDTNPNDSMLLIGAEEVTNAKVVHVNGIGINRAIPVQDGATATRLLQASIDAIRAQGGLPLINHPNFAWAFSAQDMLPLKGVALLEIASGHPMVNHAGDGHTPSTEHMWDQLLTAGMRIFAVAVDDVHYFREEFSIERANPGRGWVVVRASALTRDGILTALSAGDFYASTGVVLADVRTDSKSLVVEIQPTFVSVEASAARSGLTITGTPSIAKRYRIVFVGRDGRVLASSSGASAKYDFVGDEGYVRARIEDSGGLRAWTQPVWLSSRP